MSSFYYSQKRGVVYRKLDFLGFPFYRIGTDGSVWTRKKKGRYLENPLLNKWKRRKLEVRNTKKGKRCMITLSRNGHSKCFLVHRIVLLAFVGPCPPGMECRHFPDRDPTNNRLENLQWGTPKQNAADKVFHGTKPNLRGEKSGHAKLTNKLVKWIRQIYKIDKEKKGRFAHGRLTWMIDELKKNGISMTKSNLYYVATRHTWK